MAVLFALVFAIPLGILSGLRPNGVVDQGSRVISTLAIAVPNFLLALILVLVVGTIRLVGSNANNAFSVAASSLK